MSEFIFMLTLNDETVPDALKYVTSLASSDVSYVGFKDVGLEESALLEVVEAIRANGQTSVLEIVDVGSEDELRSVEAALRLGVDLVIGGTRIEQIGRLLENAPVRFFPYVGGVVGHPARLEGRRQEIVAEAQRAAASPAVAGINVLAYRWASGDGAEIAAAVTAAVEKPIIAAGSVDGPERIRALDDAGVWAFTIGGAVLTGQIVPGAPFEDQIAAVLAAAGS